MKIKEIMKRETNFEVLRTVAMFFIVVYHCLTHDVGDGYGFNTDSPISLSNVLFSDFIIVLSSIAVNLYVMISGYFLVDLHFKASRVVRTWAYTCFYSFIITVLFTALSVVPFNAISIGKSLFPLSSDVYWFVTQYIGLLILSPFLAILARQLTYRQYMVLLISGAILCISIIPDFPLGKRFYVAHGNSVWSFAYLFMIAVFIKHHLKKVPMGHLFMIVVSLIVLIFVCEIIGGYNNGSISLYWLNYNGLVFILSVAVFVLVRQLQIPERGLWHLFVKVAPYTFGVYLIHDHLLVRDWLWNTVSLSSYCDKWLYPFIVIGICLVIFVTCVAVDAVRKKIFAVIGIDKFIARVDKWTF